MGDNFSFDIAVPPSKKLELIITIPCHNEPDLISSFESLFQCDFDNSIFHVEVLTVINASEDCTELVLKQNENTFCDAKKWIAANKKEGIDFYLLMNNKLPKKHAGVGLARRMAMDEACNRFELIDNENGVIVCYDADSGCEKNYLFSIYSHFQENQKSPGCSIFYEHPLYGDEFSPEVYSAIVYYESHLRYYNLCLRYSGYPGAYHTVGSSMAVRAFAYKKQGGMNKRKAGEDFYFLHKIITLGNFTELNTTTVIPSPRESDRVPFGTGRAVANYIAEGLDSYSTYSFRSFTDLKMFFILLPSFYNNEWEFESIPKSVQVFLKKSVFIAKLNEIKSNSSSYKSFEKRFFGWFNAFMILKFTHFCRDNFYPDNQIEIEINALFDSLGLKPHKSNSCLELLYDLRKIERQRTE